MERKVSDIEMKPLEQTMITLDGKSYRVEDFPEDDISSLRKGIAYRIKRFLGNGIFPYKGKVTRDEINADLDVGIYTYESKSGDTKLYIKYPKNKKENSEYRHTKERNVLAGIVDGEYKPDDFVNIGLTLESGNAYKPPLHRDDCPMNTLVKVALRLKEAPWELYSRRLKSLAVNARSTDGANIANNTRRALSMNRAMSSNQAVKITDISDLEMAFIIRDAPDASFPMFSDGEMLLIFPNGKEFKIDPDKLINIGSYVKEGLVDDQDDE